MKVDDLDRLVKAWEICLDIGGGCDGCPYYDEENDPLCMKHSQDTLKALKEARAIIAAL